MCHTFITHSELLDRFYFHTIVIKPNDEVPMKLCIFVGHTSVTNLFIPSAEVLSLFFSLKQVSVKCYLLTL